MAKSNDFLNYPYPGNNTKNMKPRVFASGRDKSIGIAQKDSKVFTYQAKGEGQFKRMQQIIQEGNHAG